MLVFATVLGKKKKILTKTSEYQQKKTLKEKTQTHTHRPLSHNEKSAKLFDWDRVAIVFKWK